MVLAAGCGRLDFSGRGLDAAEPTDAAPVDFGAGCLVGLTFDEPAWTGAAGEIVNRCLPALAGTAAAGARQVRDGVRGPVAELPAPSGCVTIPSSPSLHPRAALTVSAWIYPLALDGVNPYGVVAKRTDYTNDDAELTLFVWTDNTLWVDLDSRNDRNHGTIKLVNSRWQHVTLVYDGGLPAAQRVRLYVDGVLDATLPESSSELAPRDNPLSIGCLPEQPPTKPQIALAGRIDDVGVWARAFSDAEVAAWHAATRR